MTLTDAYEADLRGLVAVLENQDTFAPGEASAWYEGIDDAETVSDYMMVNDAIVDILDGCDGLGKALDVTVHHETDAFF